MKRDGGPVFANVANPAGVPSSVYGAGMVADGIGGAVLSAAKDC
jgi:hypothetical protein